MRDRPEKPHPAEPEIFVNQRVAPKPFSQLDAKRVQDEADEWLNGSKRFDYLFEVTGCMGLQQDIEDLHHYPKSLRMIHTNLAVISSGETQITQFLVQLIFREQNLSVTINFMHWLWMVENVKWAASELSQEEKEKLNKVYKAMYMIFRKVPELSLYFMNLAGQGGDLILMQLMEDLGLLSNENSSSSRPPELIVSLLNITDEEIRNLQGKNVLDLGSGLGEFAVVLRENGINAYTLDFLSVDELVAKFRKRVGSVLPPEVVQGYLQSHANDDFRKWHRKGSSSQIPQIFGEGFFRQIYACSSVTHSSLYKKYRANPSEFFDSMYGAILGLSPDYGELRLAVSAYNMPATMQKVMLPFALALQAGQFEIDGCYDENGDFSFQKFFKLPHTMIDQRKLPVLQIVRHPFSDPSEFRKYAK